MEAEILHVVLGTVVPAGLAYLWGRTKNYEQRQKALSDGLQALLRDRLIQGYNRYVVDKGWIPIYAKDSLMACAAAYHALGANGVMDDIIKALRDLPNHPPEEQDEKNN